MEYIFFYWNSIRLPQKKSKYHCLYSDYSEDKIIFEYLVYIIKVKLLYEDEAQ